MIPSLFVAHGAPSLVLENHGYARFLRRLPARFGRPRAIILVSAHWESAVQQIGGASSYGMIYDFGGFSEELYRIVYPAKGDPRLAEEVSKRFRENGIPCRVDRERGLDHGAWVVLSLMYPDADVPVVAMSVHPGLAPQEQYRIGRVLASLREKDVLIIGSGGTVHNLFRLHWDRPEEEREPAEEWPARFEGWLEERLTDWDLESLFQYKEKAPHAGEAVPTPEHFVPMLIAMGAGETERTSALLYRSYQYGTLTLSCWQFGGS